MKVVFKNQNGDSLFIVPEQGLDGFLLPRVGDAVIWSRLHLTVESITHNYDSQEIEIDCEVA